MTRTRSGLFVVLVLVAIAAAVLMTKVMRATPHVRDLAVASLNQRFGTHVDIEELAVGVFPQPEVSGSGIVVRPEQASDTPLVRVGAFSASAGVAGLLGTPVRLRTVHLDNLDIQIPVGGIKVVGGLPAPAPGKTLVIDEIIAHEASLRIPSKKAGKPPRIFDIHNLHIFDFGDGEGSTFTASLTNPTPQGRIDTRGRFGPWVRDEPRRTPLGGEYTFSSANLDTIKGIGGILSSRGSYSGVLERIDVAGNTDTPDFSIDVAGQPVPLKTTFKAVVDGTNGDTWLESVDAKLLDSEIHARGAVVRAEDVKGRHIALDITIDKARIQDLLKLAMKGPKPPLTGAVAMKTKFFLPAGKEDVVRKLQLDGEFTLDRATFTNVNVQRRLSELSQRARGDETPDEGESVVSKLRGRFQLREATLKFSDLSFAVPGATVQLAGNYHLEQETLDFAGHLLLDASLRDTTSGFKAVLAIVAQPFFRRPGGGSKLPIRVVGTRSKPQFGLDLRKAFLPG